MRLNHSYCHPWQTKTCNALHLFLHNIFLVVSYQLYTKRVNRINHFTVQTEKVSKGKFILSLILMSNSSRYICVIALWYNVQVKLINYPTFHDNKSRILSYCTLQITYVTNPVYIKLHWPHLFGKMKVHD